MPTWAQQIKGVVIDQKSKETLIGAVVTVDGTNVKAITNIDGNFQIDGMKKDKTYTLYINYVGYKTQKIDGVQAKDADQVIALQPDEQQLKEVTVTAVERRNTDAAMIQVAKNSPVIVSNVSAQEISRTQDTNAGEVIRRVPGVSLIDEKFVMVRGLSQRYNNVWVNGGAVPSSEADSRAFSFDIIPSSQIDNLTIVKSPTAEYPADYSGGFIIVNTKEVAHHVEAVAVAVVDAGVGADADVEQHEADSRCDAGAHAVGDGLDDLFAHVAQREDQEHDAFGKHDDEGSLEGGDVARAREGGDLRYDQCEEAV